jgi:hypothetical protein
MRFLLTLASLAAMIGIAAPAHADSTDDGFLAALGGAGLTYPDPDKAVAAGKSVCKMSGDQGMSTINVDMAIHNTNPKLTWDQAVQFVNIATDAYCPAAPST